MSHTNSTTNYALPQFLTTDKPAWLTDINNAFLAIDTGMDAAKDAADNAQSDATQALTDAGNAATAAATADAKGAGAVASIEAAFDASAVYSVGAKVMYNNLLYRCNVAVVTPGPWTGSANWERITVDSIIPADAAALPLGSTTPAGSTAEAIADLQNNKANKSEAVVISAGVGFTCVYASAVKTDKAVVCNTAFEKSTAWATGWVVVGTTNALPSTSVYCPLLNASQGGVIGMCRIDADGTINFYLTGSGTVRLAINICYATA